MSGRVVCIEGPSAVGKTSRAAALAAASGAVVVEEVTGAPPLGNAPERWFVERHCEHWARAVEVAARAPFAVLDGDPFKALWYGATFASDPAAAVAAARAAYADAVARGAIGVPDLYVALDTSEAELRARRAGDATRRRGGFEQHLRLADPLRRWFAEVKRVLPGRVLRLDTRDRDSLAPAVLDAVARLPPGRANAAALVERMAAWLIDGSVQAS